MNTSILDLIKQGKQHIVDNQPRLAIKLILEDPTVLNVTTDLYYILGVALYKGGLLSEGQRILESNALLSENVHTLSLLCGLSLKQNQLEKAKEYYVRACNVDRESPFLALYHRVFSDQAEKKSVLLVTLPKSGSLYIWAAISGGLDIVKSQVTFEGDELLADPEKVRQLVKLGNVTQTHLEANVSNIRTLVRCGQQKIVLHLRDPRECLLSWTHHLDKYRIGGKRYPLHYEVIPGYFDLMLDQQIQCPAYYDASLEKKLDMQIESYLPWQIQWIKQWLAYYDKPNRELDVLITDYGQLKRDQDALFNSVLDHYGIAHSKFAYPEGPRVGDNHYRSGDSDEWRRVLTDQQQARMNALIDPALKEQMGWSD